MFRKGIEIPILSFNYFKLQKNQFPKPMFADFLCVNLGF